MSDKTLSQSATPPSGGGIDWPELDAPNLYTLSVSLAHASALISHTYSEASYAGFCQLDPGEQKDYLWAIHSRLKVASKALSRVMNRRRFETPEEAAKAEQEASNG